MSLFEVKNLEKTFYGEATETKVLRGVDFTIEAGEFVSIMGPSGSGKSTLLNILGFLLDSSDGEYRFNGKQYQDHTDDEIAKIRNQEMGFVFQTFNLLPRLSVFENIQLPLMYSNRPESEWKTRVEEVVEIVGLSHRIDFEAYKLSGGEKQRVAIARALVNSPSVIFADEPTGNLDSKSGGAIMQTLQRLHDELGHTVLLITHETFTAEHADRMIHIVDGKVERDEKIKNRREANKEFIK